MKKEEEEEEGAAQYQPDICAAFQGLRPIRHRVSLR
jgi:hypothetical protein